MSACAGSVQMSVVFIEKNKMQAAVILTAATVTLALENVASAGTLECEADHQCESGYCYPDTGMCVSCIDCASYLRQSSQWRTCARGPQDCGECLSGFEHEYLTDGTTRNFCVQKKELGSGILDERSPYFWLIITTCVGTFILLVFVVLRIYRATKTRMGVQNSNPDVEDPPSLGIDNENDNPPPSYDSSIPLLNQLSGVSSALVTSLTVIEKEGNTLQQAVPFSNPYPPYGNGGPTEYEDEHNEEPVPEELNFPDNPWMDSGDEDEGPRAISPPPLDDEDTMPSNWMPFNVSDAVPDEPPCDEERSATSSLSDISNLDVSAGSSAQEVPNDSGVSASSSHQSDLLYAHGVDELHVLTNGQGSSTSNIHPVLQRRHSDEDLSALSEMRDRKRQRRDSGSSSMKSVEPYTEKT